MSAANKIHRIQVKMEVFRRIWLLSKWSLFGLKSWALGTTLSRFHCELALKTSCVFYFPISVDVFEKYSLSKKVYKMLANADSSVMLLLLILTRPHLGPRAKFVMTFHSPEWKSRSSDASGFQTIWNFPKIYFQTKILLSPKIIMMHIYIHFIASQSV